MPSRSRRNHDFMTVGRDSVEQIIGEKLTDEPLEDPNAGKSPPPVALRKLGGAKGGKARCARNVPMSL